MSKPVSIEDLLLDVRACRLCADLPLGPRPILQLSASSKVLIVGQAPGRITHHRGVPFDDPSGDRLRQWLGVDRTAFYDSDKFALLPMGFCYPGTGKGGDLPPRPECAPAWRKPLLEKLGSVDLTIVLGKHAIGWHAPESSRQSILDCVADWRSNWPHQVIFPHPSPRNNRWLKLNPFFEKEVVPLVQKRVLELLSV